MSDAITKSEMIEIMEHYVRPIYEVIGSALAIGTVALATYVVLKGAFVLGKRLGL